MSVRLVTIGLLLGASVAVQTQPQNQNQTSQAKRKALDQACSNGVLSPEECARKRAELNPQSPAAPAPTAGQLWHEPHGRFTIIIPAGWQVDESQGNLKLTNGDSWANFNTTSGPATPLAAAQKEAEEMHAMIPEWKVYNQGTYQTAAHHPAAGVSVTCTVPTRTGPSKRVMLFLAQSAGNNNYVTMTSSVDAPTGEKPNATLSQTFDTVRFQNEN